jgi:hypothetical protein
MIKTELTCPLGSKCEEIKDNTIKRCRWYTLIQGMNPQTGESMDKWDCAISWIPILTLEMSRTNQGQTAALESFRNEMVEGTDKLIGTIAIASTNNLMLKAHQKSEEQIITKE